MTTMLDDRMTRQTGVVRGTGREKPDWFEALDALGAAERPYREIAAWLRDEHGMSAWWAQKVTVEYQQARGTRAPGVRHGGTFEVTGSKALAVATERVLEAFTDPLLRKRWLPGVDLRERSRGAGTTIRFDLGEAGERVAASVTSTVEGRCQVAIQHDRLPDLEAATAAKAAWRERLAALKALLEG